MIIFNNSMFGWVRVACLHEYSLMFFFVLTLVYFLKFVDYLKEKKSLFILDISPGILKMGNFCSVFF